MVDEKEGGKDLGIGREAGSMAGGGEANEEENGEVDEEEGQGQHLIFFVNETL